MKTAEKDCSEEDKMALDESVSVPDSREPAKLPEAML